MRFVGDDDTVYHLGDFTINKKKKRQVFKPT